MTLSEYNSIAFFPQVFISLTDYEASDVILKKGETFVGVRKQTIGNDDYSIIDNLGHPHHFTGVKFPINGECAEIETPQSETQNITSCQN